MSRGEWKPARQSLESACQIAPKAQYDAANTSAWRFRCLVASPLVQDLLLCAKHLFVAARTVQHKAAVIAWRARPGRLQLTMLAYGPSQRPLDARSFADPRFLVSSRLVRDLLLCAKHLFVAAIGGGGHDEKEGPRPEGDGGQASRGR